MLDLIERIGTEFRVPIILSSHLLGEIERVCEHLVEIAGGRLVRSVPMSTLTRATGLLMVEVDGEIDALAANLSQQGLSVSRGGRMLLVSAGRRRGARQGTRRGGGPEPGARPARAAPRGRLEEFSRRPAQKNGRRRVREAARRQHLRPGVPALQRAPAGTPARYLGDVCAVAARASSGSGGRCRAR